ncbi:unnamed protein product, partial [Vitis vinifera]
MWIWKRGGIRWPYPSAGGGDGGGSWDRNPGRATMAEEEEGMEEERLEEMMRVVLKVREARCLQSSMQGRRWPCPKKGNTMIWADIVAVMDRWIFGMRLRRGEASPFFSYKLQCTA